MSKELSRRELFALLASPLTRTKRRAAASEQRLHHVKEVREAKPNSTRECARCYSLFAPEGDELHCPACAELAAKERGLLTALYK